MRATDRATASIVAMLALLCHAPPGAAAISADEQRVLDALDASRTLADMRLISASSDGIAQGVGEGSVVAGSSEEAALADTIARRFRELGLATRVADDPHAAALELQDGVVPTVVTHRQPARFRAGGKREELVPEADPQDRRAARDRPAGEPFGGGNLHGHPRRVARTG